MKMIGIGLLIIIVIIIVIYVIGLNKGKKAADIKNAMIDGSKQPYITTDNGGVGINDAYLKQIAAACYATSGWNAAGRCEALKAADAIQSSSDFVKMCNFYAVESNGQKFHSMLKSLYLDGCSWGIVPLNNLLATCKRLNLPF